MLPLIQNIPLGFFITILINYNNLISISAWTLTTDNSENCGSLFSEPNFNGHELKIKSGEHIPDLHNFFINEIPPIPFRQSYEQFKNWSQLVRSIRVNPGCSLNVSSLGYSDGQCQLFTGNSQQLERNWDQNIASASCVCSTDCNRDLCPSVKLKTTECGRLYFEDGCNTCSQLYLNILPIEKKIFTGVSSSTNQLKFIVVRDNCNLIVFKEQFFKGEPTKITNGTRANFEVGDIGSYNCSCGDTDGDSEFGHTSFPTRPPDGLRQLKIHGDSASLIRLAKTMSSPHPGITAAFESAKNGKSPKNAYILLLGLRGSGKSSTMNFLLNNLVNAPRGGQYMETRKIEEFRFPVPLPTLGIKNSELRVIDTPGFFSTNGLDDDSRLLATLDNYLDNHEELRDRTPNIVMIFTNFNHNRLNGSGPGLVNMLRELYSFTSRIFTKKYSNVIFVLSRYMDSSESLQRNPTIRLKEFQSAIEDSSLLPKPVVLTVAENKPKYLPMVNGHYQLPNGDSYPKNLITQIFQTTENSGDPIGSAIFKNAFRDPEILKKPKCIEFPLMDRNYTQNYFNALLRLHDKFMTETEISILLKTTNEREPLASSDTLLYLQRFFNLRNIFQRSDLPKTNFGMLGIFKDVSKIPEVVEIIQKAFPRLQTPILESSLLPGQGFDIFRSKILPRSIKSNNFKISEIGYRIPDYLSCRIENQVVNRHKTVANFEEYFRSRFESMSVSDKIVGNISSVLTQQQGQHELVLPGYTILSNSPGQGQGQLTVVVEFRLFLLTLENEKVNLNPEFIKTVNELPAVDQNNEKSIRPWQQFFSVYGTHVIKSVHGGGSIEISANRPTNNLTIEQFAQSLFKSLNLNEVMYNANSSLTFRGGDPKYHTTDLTQFEIFEAAKLLENWKESLALQPILLESTIKLIPMSEFLKIISPTVQLKFSEAEAFFFNAATNQIRPELSVGSFSNNYCF